MTSSQKIRHWETVSANFSAANAGNDGNANQREFASVTRARETDFGVGFPAVLRAFSKSVNDCLSAQAMRIAYIRTHVRSARGRASIGRADYLPKVRALKTAT